MKYMALIYGTEDAWSALSEEEQRKATERYMALSREATDGAELQDSDTATTVRVRDGETLTTDGPFAETKEQLGGYYLIDCGSLDEAIEFAARIPAAERGVVEVRPVVER
ncbi:MAG: YciI family protein [Actinobacteria bacterium]|nr:MAG: YciI family protein [Actinomycetota bacterium]